jgi:hypothetical protein
MDISKIFNDHFSKIKNINAATVDIKNLEVNDVGVISTDYDISNIRHITASGNLSIGGNISGASFAFKTLANGLYNDALLSNDGFLADINTKYCLRHYEQTGNLVLQGSNSTSSISLKIDGYERVNITQDEINIRPSTYIGGSVTPLYIYNDGSLLVQNTLNAIGGSSGSIGTMGGITVTKNLVVGGDTTRSFSLENSSNGVAIDISGNSEIFTDSGNQTRTRFSCASIGKNNITVSGGTITDGCVLYLGNIKCLFYLRKTG